MKKRNSKDSNVANVEENNNIENIENNHGIEKREDVINSVSEYVEKSGITRIASNLEEKIKEYELGEKESFELKKRLSETKVKNIEKEEELNRKTEMLSLELEKFIEKANIIKEKNEEFENKVKSIKQENIESESETVAEVDRFNEKIVQNLEIDEKFEKLKLANKNIIDMKFVDRELTSELEINKKDNSPELIGSEEGNEDSKDNSIEDEENENKSSGTATVIIDED